ncbi:MAG TPA: histidine phosphatase family protein, partial [Candidatus Intestinimonas merdavium]|nr:histidine phosphatase family protein [Candidatus Intestinimonas merdavium]
MEVILVRHGITEGNKEKRFVGRLDVPLAPEGEAMAWETAPLM